MKDLSKRISKGLILTFALFALTSCSQSQIYAMDKTSGTYLVIPKGWNKITKADLAKAESKSTAPNAAEKLANVIWQEAYSTSPKITASQVLNLQAPEGAVVYVRVRNLNFEESNSISNNSLRNLIAPVTSWLEDPSKANPKFVLIDDYERIEKAARGIRTIYTFADDSGVSETVDQTALLSEDRTRVYILLVRAKTKYYDKHVDELLAIGDSFTVRGDK
ncbi:MAG: hypothetical protein F2853_03320 [Actinobacteria bacterium]|uniref:Unannotated protein n=1 Tax=freshwater metagenome TaxID=449393 RepID=A0A6J7KG43_9ZZZZ|nr:hypothetical protein [Actinomycetota bacterium]MSZ01854.1 hypothetical protein [Actinomycetota bacterium]